MGLAKYYEDNIEIMLERQTAMESACRQMESDRSLHRKNKAESETGSSGRRRLCDESSLKKGGKKLSFPL